jgi:integrase
MTKNSAMTKLANGVKVFAKGWEDGKYIYMDEKSGQILDNENKNFNLMSAKEKVWFEYKEPLTSKCTTQDNSELVNMIKQLMNEVKSIKEAQETQYIDIDSNEVAYDVKTALKQDIEQSIKENMPQDETSLKDMIKVFFNVEKSSEVKELFKKELSECKDKREVAKVISKFIPYCWMGGRKIKTVARYYADMRGIIKELDNQFQDYALELFSIPSDVYERITKADTKKVIEKLKDKETFSLEEIKSLIAKLKKQCEIALKLGENATIEQWKEAGLPIAKQQTVARARAYLFTAYLSLVTGRRITEILKTLSIVKKGDKWYFRGIAKKGSDEVEILAVSLEKDFEFLNKLLNQIRKDIDTKGMDNKQVNSKYNHIFNRSLKNLTGLKYTYHDFREIYADLAYREFGLKDGTDREEIDYKSDILGHQVDKDRLVATEHYMTKKGE